VRTIVLLVLFLFVLPAKAIASQWEFLKWDTLYENSIANPHSPEFSLSVNHDGLIQAKIGKGLTFLEYKNENIRTGIGLEACAWLALKSEEGAFFPLLTEDFIFSFPIALQYKDLTLAIKWNHISAHLGDGSPGKSITYSRDFISFHMSKEYKLWKIKAKSYGHIGQAYKIYPDVNGFFVGAGEEIILYSKILSPYIAIEINYNADNKSVDLSSQLGLWLETKPCNSFSLRVALTSFFGDDRRGQRMNKKINNIGIGVFIK